MHPIFVSRSFDHLPLPLRSVGRSCLGALLAGLTLAVASPALAQRISGGEVTQLKVEMAETSYELSSNARTLARLVTAYEGAVGYHCLGNLTKTLQQPPTAPSQCTLFIEKILALDPANPIAICARDGIDSKSCKAAAEQKVEIYSPHLTSEHVGKGDALDAQLSMQKRERELNAISAEFDSKRRQYQQTATPDRRKELQQLAGKLLVAQCADTLVTLRPPSGQEGGLLSAPAPLPTPLTERQSGGGLLDSSEGKTLVETGARSPKKVADESSGIKVYKLYFDGPAQRVRFVPQQCDMAMEKVKLFDPKHPGIVCAREGFYDPRCIAARRRERKSAAAAPSRPSAPQRDEMTQF